MAIIKIDKAPIEEVARLLRAGVLYRDISAATGSSTAEVSVIARVLGLTRKRGPKPGSKRKPKAASNE
jgi:hypothetical protein